MGLISIRDARRKNLQPCNCWGYCKCAEHKSSIFSVRKQWSDFCFSSKASSRECPSKSNDISIIPHRIGHHQCLRLPLLLVDSLRCGPRVASTTTIASLIPDRKTWFWTKWCYYHFILLKYAFIVNKGPHNLKKNTYMNLEFSFKVSLWTHTIKCHYQIFLLLKFPGYSHFQIHVINQPIWKGPIMLNVHSDSPKSGK